MSNSDDRRVLAPARLEVLAPSSFPMVERGDALDKAIRETLTRNALSLTDGDVVVLAQKIVSKAEGRLLDLATVIPSSEAERLAAICGKDPRLVEAILSESTDVVRCKPGVIIVRHKRGWVLANAGIDHSNITQNDSAEHVLLLPQDPDASASALRESLTGYFNITIGVMIIDSFGRAWRLGTCGTCIGAAGLATVQDLRGRRDLTGGILQSSILGYGDELAAAASLLMGQAAEGRPMVIIRGLNLGTDQGQGSDLIRPREEDLFS